MPDAVKCFVVVNESYEGFFMCFIYVFYYSLDGLAINNLTVLESSSTSFNILRMVINSNLLTCGITIDQVDTLFDTPTFV